MRCVVAGAVFAAVACAVFAAVACAAMAGPWPGGKHAAVVLTYDDALTSQLDIALPALDAAGLKGTFFLTGSGLKPETVARWRAAAAAGHELGNHTVFHACARAAYPAPERYTTETYTVDTMLTEIRVMNAVLTAIDGKPVHAMATPCGAHLAGGVDYLPALRQSGLVRYDRGVGGTVGDPLDVPSVWFAGKATGADMIAAVEKTEATGGLIVFGFHGVGGDYLTTSAEAHAALVAYLKAHQDTLWVAPFSTVMDAAAKK
jgi:peptidoglycan/xylan/chitin deacetylase (PgdA/CDA1 family)